MMSRKEEIIYAALELASENGLKAVSMSQIAEKVGIKKPSLYNHFKSKEELVGEMYVMLREQAHKHRDPAYTDPASFFSGRTLEEILLMSCEQYGSFISDKDMMKFFKVIYSERCTSKAAAQIMLDETERMTAYVRELFYALVVHGKMKNDDVDTAALIYAMTIHSLIDRQMDSVTAGRDEGSSGAVFSEDIRSFVKWFSRHMET